MPPSQLPPASSHLPIFLAGPTAVGKSALALALAEAVGGEIISVDSMMVYRGLDIGTAKPSPAERAKVPHHLIDVCELDEAFDAAQFIRLAKRAVEEIESRGRTPIFCGGTGLYFKAYLEGLGEAPATDAALRAELEAAPLSILLQELRERDPAAYETIDRQNPRRVVRAVEVIRLTGRPFSAQKSEWGEVPGSPASTARIFCLTRKAPDLHQRIHSRVDEMFAQGLVAETEQLLQRGLLENKFALQAIGYRQVTEHLRGEHSLKETLELVKIRTRQYAKRQLTWFRRHGNCEWIELQAGEPATLTLAKMGIR